MSILFLAPRFRSDSVQIRKRFENDSIRPLALLTNVRTRARNDDSGPGVMFRATVFTLVTIFFIPAPISRSHSCACWASAQFRAFLPHRRVTRAPDRPIRECGLDRAIHRDSKTIRIYGADSPRKYCENAFRAPIRRFRLFHDVSCRDFHDGDEFFILHSISCSRSSAQSGWKRRPALGTPRACQGSYAQHHT